jgi:3-oxoacyl-[acyl-carrier protein] reductase
VNNAGVYRFGSAESVTVDELHRQFDTNVLGPMLAVREALPLFGAEGGSIINVGTGATELTPPNAVIYIASKLALNGVTGVLARELGPRRIRVNSLNPGMVATEGVPRVQRLRLADRRNHRGGPRSSLKNAPLA